LLTTNYEPKSGAPRLAIDPTKNSSLFEVPHSMGGGSGCFAEPRNGRNGSQRPFLTMRATTAPNCGPSSPKSNALGFQRSGVATEGRLDGAILWHLSGKRIQGIRRGPGMANSRPISERL